MTTAIDPAYAAANDVQRVVEAALSPGGTLYLELEALIARAANVAMDETPGLADSEERGEAYGWEPEQLELEIALVVAERLFQATLAYGKNR